MGGALASGQASAKPQILVFEDEKTIEAGRFGNSDGTRRKTRQESESGMGESTKRMRFRNRGGSPLCHDITDIIKVKRHGKQCHESCIQSKSSGTLSQGAKCRLTSGVPLPELLLWLTVAFHPKSRSRFLQKGLVDKCQVSRGGSFRVENRIRVSQKSTGSPKNCNQLRPEAVAVEHES